jgi:hypothetical protein
MPIGTEMKRLTQDIASSREVRARRLGEMGEEVNQMRVGAQHLIEGFQTTRKHDSNQLCRDLVSGKSARRAEVDEMLAGLNSWRIEGEGQMRQELVQAANERVAEVNAMLKEARQAIRDFGSCRNRANKELKEELAESRSANKSEVERFIGGARKARELAGDKLRKNLARGRADIRSAFHELRRNFRNAQKEIRADLKEAAAAWQDLTGGKTLIKARVTEESPDYKARLLAVVNEHPEGITLADVADTLGVVPVVLGRASKTLTDKGEISKEGKRYFPAAGK